MLRHGGAGAHAAAGPDDARGEKPLLHHLSLVVTSKHDFISFLPIRCPRGSQRGAAPWSSDAFVQGAA